ncbi:CG12883 [Drosophila busckii]|uniref:CG12883 n=1 Tax=Drosophila busckii TaxID=30019 RepID=A0A0M4EL57_DROBS|nr:uncharacterized protein LOC108601751 [Drosophila busckii]ALC45965.1 CG12883 [Drosophila busckii]
MAASSYKGKVAHLIKCFCGCTDMTVDEVQRIYTLTNSVLQTLLDSAARRLLQRFLETERAGDKKGAEIYLEIYIKCAEYLKDTCTFTQDEIDELDDLGLPYHLTQELTRRTLNADRTKINLCLNNIQNICSKEIEASSEFRRFRDAILAKMNRIPKK